MASIPNFVVLILYLVVSHTVFAYYGDIFNSTSNIPPLNLGISVAVADTLYIFGGLYGTSRDAKNFNMTTLKFDSKENIITNTIRNTTEQLFCFPCNAYSLQDNKTIVSVNMQYPSIATTNALGNVTTLRFAGLSFYDTSSNIWTNPQNNSFLPPMRDAFMSAISPENDAIYVMGGYRSKEFNSMNEIHRFDLKNTSSVVNITATDPNLNISMIGGSAQMLP